jgi:signal-transduction protein with cAMP-binding, CBS, and nucleotidyltransferase domain
MMDNVNPLTISEIEILKKDFEVLTFSNDFDLVYENQVPCTGIALIEGCIELIKDTKVHKKVQEGNLLGVSQLISEKPVKYGCKVKAKSKIILLGKSDILNLRQNKKLKNHPAVKSMRDL